MEKRRQSKYKEEAFRLSSNDHFGIKVTILFLFVVALYIVSFSIGRFSIPPKMLMDIMLSNFMPIEPYWGDNIATVVMNVRFPRIMLGLLVGGALAVSGASYQTLFKNPMASPDILGVSAGAGFGAALAMLNDANWWTIQLSAFLFGLMAVAAAYLIATIFAQQSITVLILAGVVISSFFQALISIIKTLADTDNQLPSITFWLMGSLARGSNKDLLFVLPAIFVCLLLLFFFRHHINALAAGEDEAIAMGVNVPLVKGIIVCCSTLMTVSVVSISGIIGWVGMVVPHIARMLVGSGFSRLILTSFFIGGGFLLMIDDVVRGVEGVELPLGVLTALIGTPVFVILLTRVGRGWS